MSLREKIRVAAVSFATHRGAGVNIRQATDCLEQAILAAIEAEPVKDASAVVEAAREYIACRDKPPAVSNLHAQIAMVNIDKARAKLKAALAQYDGDVMDEPRNDVSSSSDVKRLLRTPAEERLENARRAGRDAAKLAMDHAYHNSLALIRKRAGVE